MIASSIACVVTIGSLAFSNSFVLVLFFKCFSIYLKLPSYESELILVSHLIIKLSVVGVGMIERVCVALKIQREGK